MTAARILARALRDPHSVSALDANGWTALLTIARAELLLGTLAHLLRNISVPDAVAPMLEDARINAEYQRRSALWEADCARRAMAGFDGKIALMKGTAYVAAGLKAGEGRHIGDLDIMVAEHSLPEAERLLMDIGGWEWVKEDDYDDTYYRDHMHELPPLIHKERDRMIDVHHTILPKTARPTPDALSMLEDGRALDGDMAGLSVFSPQDMVCHCAAHLIADGDLTGGMRNLWDMHCLLSEFAQEDEDFWPKLQLRAQHHQLWGPVFCAARLAWQIYGTIIPSGWQIRGNADVFYIRRLLARDQWGRGKYPLSRLGFYIRSHLLRMPPIMLARHLWAKWRKG